MLNPHVPQVDVFARFKAKRGEEDPVRAALLDMIEPTIEENANLGYAVHQSLENPGHFFLYEQWESQEGLDNHRQQPYYKELELRLEGRLKAPMEAVTTRIIGGATAPTAAGAPSSA